MFITTSRPLNGLLLVALLIQLVSGCPSQVVELWCLEEPQPCYQTVVRRRRPPHQAPFSRQLAWLTQWMVSVWPRWLVRCGLLLAVLLWKRAVWFPLVWGLLVWPLVEVVCLGLGVLCRSSGWRHRWWRLAQRLAQGYGWVVWLLLVTPPSVAHMPPLLLLGGLLVSSHQGTPTDGTFTSTGLSTRLFSGAGPGVASHLGTGVGSIQIVQSQQTTRLLVQGPTVIELPRQDRTAWRWLVHLLANNGLLPLEEVPGLLELSQRTVQRDRAAYQQEQDSACLVDRRQFSLGQRTAYRAEECAAVLISQWVLNLLTDAPNNGRRLETQLEGLLDDRTIDRALERWGLSDAEAAGLRQQVQNFLEAVRQAAYWAGVEQRPLDEVAPPLPEAGWQQQVSDRATLSLATLHLVRNGAYTAAWGLMARRQGCISALRAWHSLLVYLAASGGARLSGAKHLPWAPLRGLLGGRIAGVSASFLRHFVVEAAETAEEPVTVQRSDGGEETITRLQAYQEESVAQRVQRGLVKAQAIWLDCYANGVSRREAIARAWHGTKHWAVKAFRRNVAQDVETGHVVTCPLSASDVTALTVLQQVVTIINGGLDRAGVAYRVTRVTADRWWSVADVLAYCLEHELGFLCWAKAVKNVLEALDGLDEQDPGWEPIRKQVVDPDSGQVVEQTVGYRLETELTVYDLPTPLRAIVDWDGEPGGQKVARLAVGVAEMTLEADAVCDELRWRQRVEILIKFLHRWLQLPNFGGGEAVARPDEAVCPDDEETLKKLETQRKRTTTCLRKAQARLEQVEAELEHLTADEKHQPRNSLGLGVQDLRSLGKRLRGQIERATTRLQELRALLAWGRGQGSAPEQQPVHELNLTREAVLTQLKLDVFTAYETLVDEFIELALKPVLRQEAQRQAAERRRLDKRSTAKGREGEPLCTDAETLYQIKVANLERETILERLLNQSGRHLYHPGERILVTVADRFSGRRMQVAYERYCHILNQRQIRVPIDEGQEWLLLFTYEKPPASGDKSK